MITDIQIANIGTRLSDFTYESMRVVETHKRLFFIDVHSSLPLARVEHDGADIDGDIEIAKQLCLQKLSD